MKWLKVGGVILGALLITALGIDAADTLSGSRSTLLGQVIGTGESGPCPAGMVFAPMALTFTCADTYEASADAECPYPSPTNEIETLANLESSECRSTSKASADTWRFITREQAQTACMKAGKRLPKSDEWYLLSVGTTDDASKCNIDSNGVSQAGENVQCKSAIGALDTIGNAWEWTSDDVINGQYQGRQLPSSGFVSQVDAQGVATLTNDSASIIFYKDYFWSSQEGAFGILRGGFYGSRSDAGVYSVHAQTLPTAAGAAIGFRCIK